MIKRFASHFIFLPGHGYLKQYVVGVEEGQVVSAFPLTEEIFCPKTFPSGISAYLLYPFDFTTMLPVDGTRHRLLR